MTPTKGYASAEDVCGYIRKSGAVQVEVRLEHIQSILDTLIYDGKIEAIEDPRGPSFMGGKTAVYYKPTKLGIMQNGLTKTPCGVCPVFAECTPGGIISPTNCVYLNKWLDF